MHPVANSDPYKPESIQNICHLVVSSSGDLGAQGQETYTQQSAVSGPYDMGCVEPVLQVLYFMQPFLKPFGFQSCRGAFESQRPGLSVIRAGALRLNDLQTIETHVTDLRCNTDRS
jgi:hypothetical protein